MTMQRLLLVNAHGADEFSGGAEAYVARLGDGFAARGTEVEYLAAYPSDPRGRRVHTLYDTHWRESRARKIHNHAGSVASFPSSRLDEAIERAAPDLVHTNNLPGIWTGIWEAARRRGIPVVHTIHDYQLLCPRVNLLQPDGSPCEPHPLLCGFRQRRLRRWAGAVSHVIGVSQFVLDRHEDFFPAATPEKIWLLAFPPDEELSPPGERLRTVGYLGALEITKGIRALLDSAPALARAGCTLLVAGDGRLRGDVEEAASSEPNVEYVGPVAGAAKQEFLARVDAGILPSVWHEPGAPATVVLEWLAARRPLLVSPRGGIREVLPQLEGSIAVEPTAEAIGEAVERLTDPDEWRRAVAAVRPPRIDNDLDRWLGEHARIYGEALKRKKR